jgi:uncharacterized cupin superfamily protein
MEKISIREMTPDEAENSGILSWPVWTKEISRFDWTYSGKEECYILEGEFSVETEDGTFHIKPGDFVVFSNGLKCTWDIKVPVKKHYNFP